jgi:nitrogen fixation-related uncharacterized protein
MNDIVIIALSGLSILTLILGSLLWGYERAQHTDAQERAENLEAARRIETGRKLNENSHGDGFEYRD